MFPGPGKATQGTNNCTDFLKARFVGYLRTQVTSAVSSASETSITSMKRSASDSLLVSSTPRSQSPTWKRPAVVRTDRMQGSFQLQEIPGVYRPRDKWCHCTDGNLIHTSVWEVVGVSGAWRILTNQISTAEIPQCSKILYYIHQTLLPHVLMVWERD